MLLLPLRLFVWHKHFFLRKYYPRYRLLRQKKILYFTLLISIYNTLNLELAYLQLKYNIYRYILLCIYFCNIVSNILYTYPYYTYIKPVAPYACSPSESAWWSVFRSIHMYATCDNSLTSLKL